MSTIQVEGITIKYEDLFRAPEKDGAVVSVRVHRSVKEALAKLAEREGLNGISELIRYLIAGFLIGKYQIIKPEPKVLAPPIYLNVNVSKVSKEIVNSKFEIKFAIKSEIEDVINEVMEFINNVKKGIVKLHGNDYVRKLKEKLIKCMIKALKHGLDDEYERVKSTYELLTNYLMNNIR